MPKQLETGGDELGLISPTEKPVVLKLKYIVKIQIACKVRFLTDHASLICWLLHFRRGRDGVVQVRVMTVQDHEEKLWRSSRCNGFRPAQDIQYPLSTRHIGDTGAAKGRSSRHCVGTVHDEV
jgi:hypothetical protein